MGQKLAVSTVPTHGLLQNMACNYGRKPTETTRTHKGTSQNQFFLVLDYLIFPLVSFDFLWFPSVGWIRWFSNKGK